MWLWYSSNTGALENVKYSISAITPRFTLTGSGSICFGFRYPTNVYMSLNKVNNQNPPHQQNKKKAMTKLQTHFSIIQSKNICLLFLWLMANQPSWVIKCQSHPCKRRRVWFSFVVFLRDIRFCRLLHVKSFSLSLTHTLTNIYTYVVHSISFQTFLYRHLTLA